MKYSNQSSHNHPESKQKKILYGKYLKNHLEKSQYHREKSSPMTNNKLLKYKITNKFK